MIHSLPPAPDVLFGQLFVDVQLDRVFPDAKTFVDCVPMLEPANVVALYEAQKHKPDFNLATFVQQHFVIPDGSASAHVSDTSLSTAAHIHQLWEQLTRPTDVDVVGSSRLSLPHPYVVPGGRFREIFYWDSYFTMLGLKESGRTDLIRGMLDNFAYLIEQYGFIPNGNRTYFLSRSQPPFFALMVQLLAQLDGPDALTTYRPALQREYDFWMRGHDQLSVQNPVVRRVVRLADGAVLNRYWDDTPLPRPEAYWKEIDLTFEAVRRNIPPETLYAHIRAACESGWDFSSRWFGQEAHLVSTRTADLVPVDLNVLLHSLETTLRDAARHAGDTATADTFAQRANTRAGLIRRVCWNDETGFFHDYDPATGATTSALTLAGAFPLFLNLATPEQAARVHDQLRTAFLQAGGWVTTLQPSRQQWDWPNGWAPLQWVVYKSLLNYNYAETARISRDRWLLLNDKVFRATGKMMEKYNVVDDTLEAGGGEYPNQDGFGWTNGVYLALTAEK